LLIKIFINLGMVSRNLNLSSFFEILGSESNHLRSLLEFRSSIAFDSCTQAKMHCLKDEPQQPMGLDSLAEAMEPRTSEDSSETARAAYFSFIRASSTVLFALSLPLTHF
jgi:hypothetical protein